MLIGLPRNMANFPFAEGSVMDEQFPDGFDCEAATSTASAPGPATTPSCSGSRRTPASTPRSWPIEGITGLKINYWAMVNLEGFRDLVDAVGGVTLNVRQPIPVGGLGCDVTGYIQPGVRKLNGYETLWYARAREGSDDYSRMARQKCVMNAMLQQVSPQSVLRNFGEHREGRARRCSPPTCPAGEVGRFVELALKATEPEDRDALPRAAAGQHRRPRHRPDPGEGRRGDRPAEGDTRRPRPTRRQPRARSARRTSPSPPRSSPVARSGSLSEGYAANQAEDLDSAC